MAWIKWSFMSLFLVAMPGYALAGDIGPSLELHTEKQDAPVPSKATDRARDWAAMSRFEVDVKPRITQETSQTHEATGPVGPELERRHDRVVKKAHNHALGAEDTGWRKLPVPRGPRD